MVLGLAPGPEPCLPDGGLAAVRDRVAVLVPADRRVGLLLTKYVLVVSKKSRPASRPRTLGRGIEDGFLQGLADLQQPVHRPVAGIVARRAQAGDQHVLAGPAGGGELGGGGQRPVRRQREQHPLRRRVQLAALQHVPHRRADAEAAPQRVQRPGPAERPGLQPAGGGIRPDREIQRDTTELVRGAAANRTGRRGLGADAPHLAPGGPFLASPGLLGPCARATTATTEQAQGQSGLIKRP